MPSTPGEDAREGSGEDQRGSVEDLVDPSGQSEKFQAGHTGGEEVHRSDGAPGVEPAGSDRGGAEEDTGEHRKQVGRTDGGIRRAERASEQDTGDRRDHTAVDQGSTAVSRDVDAGEAGDVGTGADEEQVTPGGGVGREVPGGQGEHKTEVEDHLKPEYRVAGEVDQPGADAGGGHDVDAECGPAEQCPSAERDHGGG